MQKLFFIRKHCSLLQHFCLSIIAAFALCFSSAAFSDTPQTEKPILVTGHLNPDTDSIVSAISTAYLLNQLGKPAMPMVQGTINPETQFVLSRFELATPEQISDVSGRNVALVDFSDLKQAPAGFAQANLVFVADHHKLGDVTSASPLEAWIMPLGSTSTVLYQAYTYYNIPIPKNIAGAMLSAILSDTVIFKSVTSTPKDQEAAKALARIAGIEDIHALGIEQFNIKSDIENVSAQELLLRDYKEFNMHGKIVGVGQIEVVDLDKLNPRKAELLAAMRELQTKNQADTVLLMLTDIMKEGTVLLVVSNKPELIENAFSAKVADHEIWLPNVMSRKSQVIPNLQSVFSQ